MTLKEIAHRYFFLVCSKNWDCARSFQILLLIFTYSLLIFTNDKTDTKAS